MRMPFLPALILAGSVMLAGCKEATPPPPPVTPPVTAPSPATSSTMDHAGHAMPAAAVDQALDVVPTDLPAANKLCALDQKMPVDPKGPRVLYKGKSYGFCCPDCIAGFKKDPAKYADAK